MNKKLPPPILVFIICYIVYTSVYIARLNFSSVASALEEMGAIDKMGIGIAGSVFFTIFSFGRLINGYLGDTVKPKFFISLGLILICISNAIIGFMPPSIFIIALWGVNSFGQSMIWGAILKVMTDTFSEEKAKKAASYLVTSTAAGNVIGIVAAPYLAEKFGIGYAFLIPGLFSGILAIPVLLFINSGNACKKDEQNFGIVSVLKDKSIYSVIAPIMMHGAIKDNINVWMAVYFADKFGIDLKSIALFIFAVPITGLIGRLSYYPLLHRMNNNEHTVAAVAFGVIAVFSAPLFFNGTNAAVAVVCLSVISAAVMIINTSYLSIFPIRFSSAGTVSSISGIMDFFTYLGAGIGSLCYGSIIKRIGYGGMYGSWVVMASVSLIYLFIIKLAQLSKNTREDFNDETVLD